MADLISRAEMLEALGHFNDYVNGDPHFLNGIETAKEIAENLPAVDAVPVEWLREKMRGYASSLKSTETAALVMVMQMWQKEQEAR